MNDLYIVCHALCSLNGRTAGGFLEKEECEVAKEVENKIWLEYNFHTMIFDTLGFTSLLEKNGSFSPKVGDSGGKLTGADDFIADHFEERILCVIDSDNTFPLNGPTFVYNETSYHVVIAVTANTPDARLSQIRKAGVSYIFAGNDVLSPVKLIGKLKTNFNSEKIMLGGSGYLNHTFVINHLVDELSIVIAPLLELTSDMEIFSFENMGKGDIPLVSKEKKAYQGGILSVKFGLKQ